MASEEKVRKLHLKYEEGTIEVTKTVIGKPATKVDKIKIRPFVTEPSSVEVHMGSWFPTGEMRGAKLDITIRVPCYTEELLPVFKQLVKLVDELTEKEYQKMSGEEED